MRYMQVLSCRLSLCFCVLLLCLTLLEAFGSGAFRPTIIDGGEVSLDFYVLALEGVGVNDVDDVSQVIKGAQTAVSMVVAHGFRYDLNYDYRIIGRANVSVNFAVLKDWNIYRGLIEAGQGFIILNAHGEVLPVPDGYSAEGWADLIADAMLKRNVTWAHMAGYPFFRVWHQSATSSVTWGEGGLKHLMGHIGKGHVTAWPEESAATKRVGISLDVEAIVSLNWIHMANDAFYVYCSYPLDPSDFENCVALEFYGRYNRTCVGVVIAFTNIANNTNHGFYVHFGTKQTFRAVPPYPKTDRDYMRGYVSAAMAILINAERKIAEFWFRQAELAVNSAIQEGRTKGLDEAVALLNDAKRFYAAYKYVGAIMWSYKAIKVAERAVEPSFLERALPLLRLLVIASAIAVLGIVGANAIRKMRANRKPGINNAR